LAVNPNAAPEPRTITPEKTPTPRLPSDLTTPMSTLRCLKMRFAGEQSLKVGEPPAGNGSHQASMSSISFGGRSLMHAAEAEERGMHARAGGRASVEHHQLFRALQKPHSGGVKAPTVHRLGGDVEQMRQDAADLANRARGSVAPRRGTVMPSSFFPPRGKNACSWFIGAT